MWVWCVGFVGPQRRIIDLLDGITIAIKQVKLAEPLQERDGGDLIAEDDLIAVRPNMNARVQRNELPLALQLQPNQALGVVSSIA